MLPCLKITRHASPSMDITRPLPFVQDRRRPQNPRWDFGWRARRGLTVHFKPILDRMIRVEPLPTPPMSVSLAEPTATEVTRVRRGSDYGPAPHREYFFPRALPLSGVIVFPPMERRQSPFEIAGASPKASDAPLLPPLYGARAYRLRLPCPSALHRVRRGSGIRSSPALREPCTGHACASMLRSTAELFGRSTPVS